MLIDPQIKQCASAYPEPKREVRIRKEADGSFTASLGVNDTLKKVMPDVQVPDWIANLLECS